MAQNLEKYELIKPPELKLSEPITFDSNEQIHNNKPENIKKTNNDNILFDLVVGILYQSMLVFLTFFFFFKLTILHKNLRCYF